MKSSMKLFGILLVIIVVLAGCSAEDKTPDATTTPQTSESQTMESEPATVTENKTEGDSGTKLTGMALIESLDYKMPPKIYLKGTTTAEGLTFTMTMYLEGESMRYETSGLEGDQVMIYDAEEGITYVYNLSEGMGFKYVDEEEGEAGETQMDENLGMDDNLPAFDENPFAEIEDTLLNAELTTFNGHEVVYYETQVTSIDGVYLTKQWISTEYWHPLKIETLIDGVVVNTYEIDEISDKYPGPGKPFEVPEDIEFLDFDNMFG